MPPSHCLVTVGTHVPAATGRSSTGRRRIVVVTVGAVNSFRGHIIVAIVLAIQSRHGRVDGNKVWLIGGIGGTVSDGSRNHVRHGGMSHMLNDPRRQMHARGGTSHSVREVDDGALRRSHSCSHANAVISNELASDGIDMGRRMQIQRRRLNGTRCRSMVVVGSRSQLGV
jgi:hypothetical protein